MAQRRHRRVGWAAALCAGLAALTGAATAPAHGPPAELAFWGGFAPDAARCQRALSRATALCIGEVTALRNSCLGDALTGGTCDQAALDARVAAARQQARDSAGRDCTSTQLQNLGYIDQTDALTDVETACRQLDTAATSAAFAPALVGGTVVRVDSPAAACVQAGALAAGRLLRTGMRTYATALDRIAALDLEPAAKQRLVVWAARHVAQTQAGCRAALTAACGADDFAATYGRTVDAFLDAIAAQTACMQQFVYVQDAVRCPTPMCGNGIQEPGEECDDGNDYDGDGCRSDCVRVECAAFASTFDLIQHAIFDTHSCAAGACHGIAQSGGLDLRAAASYDHLVDVPSNLDPARARIAPGDAQHSVLFLKLAAKTLPDQYPADQLGIGTPMPQGPVPPLSQDELEAVRLWIEGGAPRSGSVEGVGDLLHGCTPKPQAVRSKHVGDYAPGDLPAAPALLPPGGPGG